MISVIIPSYNQAEWLPLAIESVFRQTHKGLELIIVNDGATDNSLEVAKSYQAQWRANPHATSLDDFRIIEQSNKGLAAARNAGLINVRQGTQFILPLDSDDEIHPQYVEKTLPYIQDPEVAVVYTEVKNIGNDTQMSPRMKELTLDVLKVQNWICYCSLTRLAALQECGGYNTRMIHGYEDWDMWIDIIKRGWKFVLCPEHLFYYRMREGTMLDSANEKKEWNIAQIKKNHPEVYAPGRTPKHSKAAPVEDSPASLSGESLDLEFNTVEHALAVSERLFMYSAEVEAGMRTARLNEGSCIDLEERYDVVLDTRPAVHTPDVSVIIPTFNRQELLLEAVDSVCRQRGGQIEIVVVNDCGGELTAETLAALEQKQNPILVIRHKKNLGLAASRNTGASVSSGTWLLVLDDDDLLHPDGLLFLLEAAKRNPHSRFIIGDHLRIHSDADGNKIKEEYYQLTQEDLDLLYKENRLACGTFIVHRDLFYYLRGYREDLPLHEDYNFNMRAYRATRFEIVNTPVFIYNLRQSIFRMNANQPLYWFAAYGHNYATYRSLFGVSDQQLLAQQVHQFSRLPRAVNFGATELDVLKVLKLWWEVLHDYNLTEQIPRELRFFAQQCPELASKLGVVAEQSAQVSV